MKVILIILSTMALLLGSAKAQNYFCSGIGGAIAAGLVAQYDKCEFKAGLRKRKTLHILSFGEYSTNSADCAFQMKVNIKITRPWRRNAYGSFILRGTVSNDWSKICMSNIRATNLKVSHTSAMESAYQSSVNAVLPDKACINDEEGGGMELDKCSIGDGSSRRYLRGALDEIMDAIGDIDFEDESLSLEVDGAETIEGE